MVGVTVYFNKEEITAEMAEFGAVGSGAMWHVACTKRQLGCWIDNTALRGSEAVLHISNKNISMQEHPHQLDHSAQSLH